MSQYRYRPEPVDAELWIPGNEAQRTKFNIKRGNYPNPPYLYDEEDGEVTCLFPGMWLVKHLDGVVMALSEEDFNKTFEKV